MSDDLRQALKAVLEQNQPVAYGPTQVRLPGGRWLTYAEHRAHVAEQLEAIVIAAGSQAVHSAADNLPLARDGQLWNGAAAWLHRRAEALDPTTPTPTL